MKYNIRFIKPDLPDGEEIQADYRAIQQNNWYTNFGPYEQKFRAGIEGYVGHDLFAVTVSSATSGLILAIKNLFPAPIEGKRKVIIPSFTFVAGASSLVLLGYEPVFVDIDRDTLQPDVTAAKHYLENTKNRDQVCGVLLCNTFGVGNPQINDWEVLSGEFELPLIIDSAAGFGSRYEDDSKVGIKGDCEVFSFHATKPFAIGEGGAIVCSDENLATKLQRDTNFGFNEKSEAQSLGINAKLSELSAAIGVRQLKLIDERLTKRQSVLAMYKDALRPLGFNFQPNDQRSSVGFVSCMADNPELASNFIRRLNEERIQYRNYYSPPIHKHKPFVGYEHLSNLSITEEVCSKIFSLPAHGDVTQEVVDRIAIGL